MANDEIIQSVKFENESQDIVSQFEQVLFLLGHPELLGLLLSLQFLKQIGYTKFRTQKDIAKLIGFSAPTFITKKKKLEKLGLIEIIDRNGQKEIKLNFLTRVKFFNLPNDRTQHRKYIDNSVKSIFPLTKKELENIKKSNIYILCNSNNTNNTNVNNNNICKNNNNVVLKKRNEKEKTFLREDYKIVLDAYNKYKGLGLIGPEKKAAYKAIKMMFQAKRKPKQIIDFMRWLRDHETDERTTWVKFWTIWTVQKKLPEFVAGKLKLKEFEDEYKKYD